MALYVAGVEVEGIYGGTVPALEAYYGTELIWATGPPAIVQVQREHTQTGGTFTSVAETLTNPPTAGNTLLAWVALTGAHALGDFVDPAGWTVLDDDNPAGGVLWRLYAKVSDGSEQTLTVTTPSTAAAVLAYQEWTGLQAPGTVYDATNSVAMGNSAVTTMNPASVTPDQDRAAIVGLGRVNASTGTITSAWPNMDEAYNQGLRFAAHRVVTDGSATDTEISWTTARDAGGVVAVLRGTV